MSIMVYVVSLYFSFQKKPKNERKTVYYNANLLSKAVGRNRLESQELINVETRKYKGQLNQKGDLSVSASVIAMTVLGNRILFQTTWPVV